MDWRPSSTFTLGKHSGATALNSTSGTRCCTRSRITNRRQARPKLLTISTNSSSSRWWTRHTLTATSARFFKNFYNTDLLLGKRVSEQTVQSSWNLAAGASATASLACVATWYEDFRKDLTHVDVPTLVIQGDADRILPISASGLRTAKLIKGARLLVVKDGPHCITWTHAEEVNRELVSFL